MGKLGEETREKIEDLVYRAEVAALDYSDAVSDIVMHGSSWKGSANMTDQELIAYLKDHFDQFDEGEVDDEEDYQLFQQANLELLVDQTFTDSEAV